MAVQTQILHRRGTAATWTSTNPTLGAGEIGYETDTGKYKIGTGSAVWTSLGYASILPSTLTAKGDILAASAANTPARQAVGSDGQTLVADSSQTTGLGWAGNVAAGKNAVINGGFDIWQRSTSATFAGAISYPAADRWFGIVTGSASTCTMSRQTADTTNLTYGLRFGRNSGQTATGDVYVGSAFESIDSKRFAGQTVTLSFYVKVGANAPTTLYSQIRTGTGTDQSAATLFSTGWTGGLNNSQANTVSTTMTRYTQTVTLGSTVNQIMLLFTYTPTGTAGANEWFQIEGVQLELGSSATPFSRTGGSIGGELALCQRYYWRPPVYSNYQSYGSGNGYSATQANIFVNLPVQMRVNPSSIDYSTLRIWAAAGNFAVTNLTFDSNFLAPNYVGLIATASTVVSGTFYQLGNNASTSGYLGFSAEL